MDQGRAGAGEIIRARGLRRTFRTRGSVVEAVKGVDLDVERAEVFGFLGPNGAGKTTTLRMLSTLLPPSGGTAIVAGADLLREPEEVRKRIGYVGQSGGSDEQVSGRSEMVLQGRLYGMSRREARVRAAELLGTLELEEAADRPTRTYSGGQKRRLDIGIGLMHRPLLLFLDEPTTGLDPQSRARMWREVRRLRDEGTTVFLTTHYLEEADTLCDRIAIIDHGTVVALGTSAELKRQIAGDVVTIGVDGDPAATLALLRDQPFVREAETHEGTIRVYVDHGESATPLILRLLDANHTALTTLSLARPTLDDVFLKKTGHSLREEKAA